VAGRPPSLDPRFENAPITQAEIKALKESKEPEKTAELLSRFQNQRTGSTSHPQNALLHQAFDAYELNRLGLNPTPKELAYLQAGAANGQEPARTKEFIRERQAQNARWHHDAQNTARAQESLERGKASSYWYERNLRSASSEREARTERAERRTDLQAKKEQHDLQREGAPRPTPDREQDGRDDGGRGR
jgi:hypothetical protein